MIAVLELELRFASYWHTYCRNCQLGFSSKIKVPQLGSAQNLHSSGSLEPENSSSNSSLIGTVTRRAYAHIHMCLQRVSLKRLTPVDFSRDKQHSLLRFMLTKSQNTELETMRPSCTSAIWWTLAAWELGNDCYSD